VGVPAGKKGDKRPTKKKQRKPGSGKNKFKRKDLIFDTKSWGVHRGNKWYDKKITTNGNTVPKLYFGAKRKKKKKSGSKKTRPAKQKKRGGLRGKRLPGGKNHTGRVKTLEPRATVQQITEKRGRTRREKRHP